MAAKLQVSWQTWKWRIAAAISTSNPRQRCKDNLAIGWYYIMQACPSLICSIVEPSGCGPRIHFQDTLPQTEKDLMELPVYIDGIDAPEAFVILRDK